MNDASSTAATPKLAPPAHAEALARLQEEVQRTASELRRLRKENAALKARMEELKTHPGLAHDGTLVPFDNRPEALRRQIEQFIETIDRHLAQHPHE